jgi:signal transduction histidine kinase
LSISRSLVEADGGAIWAENNPDCGATFHFTMRVDTSAHGESIGEGGVEMGIYTDTDVRGATA